MKGATNLRILFISAKGDGLGVATHLSSEGHNVHFVMNKESSVGKGVVEEQSVVVNDLTSFNPDITPHVITRLLANHTPDMVMFDSPQYGRTADYVRTCGMRVLGASQWASTIDTNELYEQTIIESMGWNVKPNPKHTDAYVTCWFNGQRYMSFYTSVVYHRFMSGGVGPDLGITGVISNFSSPTRRMNEEILDPLSKVLKKVNHRGCFHIHLKVDDKGFSVDSITAALDSPLALVLFENSQVHTSDILVRLFDENSHEIRTLDPWAMAVLISVPPYPYASDNRKIVLGGVEPANLKHLWLKDVQTGVTGWTTTGLHGSVGYVTARGTDTNECRRRVYRTIKNLRVPDLQYRNDIGKDTFFLTDALRKSGWLN